MKPMKPLMDIPLEQVRDIHAIAGALIETLEEQIARRGITEGNISIDAAINCLCYALKHVDPRLDDEELLRRVTRYYAFMNLDGAPGDHAKDEGADT